MKIIRIKDIRIVMKDRTTYSIQSPIGVFKNINDAIEQYPYLTEDNKISQCPICGDYFIKYGKGDNNRVYCSKECFTENKNYQSKMRKRKKDVQKIHKQRIQDYRNHSMNWEFHQDDTIWGLGTGYLSKNRNEDFEKEKDIVSKELRRLKHRWRNEQLRN